MGSEEVEWARKIDSRFFCLTLPHLEDFIYTMPSCPFLSISAWTFGVGVEGFRSALRDDLKGFTSSSSASNAFKRTMTSCWGEHWCGLWLKEPWERRRQWLCATWGKDLAKGKGVLGEKRKEVMLQSSKNLKTEVRESTHWKKREMIEYRGNVNWECHFCSGLYSLWRVEGRVVGRIRNGGYNS